MKKVISIILILLLIFNSFGFILLHFQIIYFYKQMVFREIVKNFNKKIIELIVINKKDLDARKINYIRIDEKEFRLDGKMYDIISEEENDENILFYCINDRNEEELESSFVRLIVNNLNGEATPSSVKNIHKIINVEAIFSQEFQLPFCFQKSYMNFLSKEKISNPSIEIPTPPPKQLC